MSVQSRQALRLNRIYDMFQMHSFFVLRLGGNESEDHHPQVASRFLEAFAGVIERRAWHQENKLLLSK